MAGYSKARFVNLSPTEDEELTCGICLGIFNKPIVVNCCRQMYCDDCITDWLKSNQTCPYDRKPLTAGALSEPPRVINNVISKLKLHCDYAKFGCIEVIKLQNLKSHQDNCKFNPSMLCQNCGLNSIDGEKHDCILNLKTLNISFNDEVRRIKEEIISLKSKPLNKSDIFEMTLKSARNWINASQSPIIKDNRISDVNLLSKIINITRLSIQENSSYDSISKYISHMLNETDFTNFWHVLVYTENIGSSHVRHHKYYIDMLFGDMRFEIFCQGKKPFCQYLFFGVSP